MKNKLSCYLMVIKSCVLLSLTACTGVTDQSARDRIAEKEDLTSKNITQQRAWPDLINLADFIEDKADRTAGTQLERQMAAWIAEQWTRQGHKVEHLPFNFELEEQALRSQNLYIDIQGQSDEIIVVGAHYDAVGIDTGSHGLIDNGSGVAALISLGELLKDKTLPFTVRLLAFGAEERGLLGAKNYVQRKDVKMHKTIGMINLDTIIGGDKLYVHSAHSTPYTCDFVTEPTYAHGVKLRDAIKKVSVELYPSSPHLLHPAVAGYPEGETGSWSDHSPFACSGIDIAYLEATNFAINGKNGFDGYSQVADEKYWDCFDENNSTACNREREKAWGEIWHTKFDRRSALFPHMQVRLQKQQEQNVHTLYVFLRNVPKYMEGK
ncbi:M28 family metallopeptidase [Agaribacter flavus]|uniref:M28 family metallopeptidase n=1 Tax=Agaribacter flavus TaxID=1902781 RepID=A0ABV7FPP4_9ALTE